MIYLGSERVITQDFITHGVAEDYSGNHKSIIKINGTGKVTKVINKYLSHEDSINYHTFLNNQNNWYKNGIYECISITGKKVLMNDIEVGGNQVYIETYDGNSMLTFRICHMDSVLVKENDIINEDTIIGYQGNTGLVLSGKDVTDITYGSHVHFEVMKNGNYINPREYAINKRTEYKNHDKNINNNQIHILVNQINIREEASVNSKDIGNVYYNEYYDVIEIIVKEDYSWYKIKTDNITGYVANKVSDNWLEYIPKIEQNVITDDKKYKHLFTCVKNGKYLIRLRKGEKLFLEKSDYN